LSLAFIPERRNPRDAPHSESGMTVAFEFGELELVGRVAGHPSEWACAGIKPHSDTGWGRSRSMRATSLAGSTDGGNRTLT